MKKIILILCWNLFLSLIGWGQTSEDFFMLTREISDRKNVSWEVAKAPENEYELVFSGLFLFYKKFISSQDGSHCTFTPSCSVYALEAIKQEGPIEGILNFFDRFSRCNGMSPESYPRDPNNEHLLYDPVRSLRYE